MIRIDFQSLIWIGLGLVCGVLLLVWLWNEAQQSARERAAKKKLRRCALCFFEFEPDSSTSDPEPCPRCNAPTR